MTNTIPRNNKYNYHPMDSGEVARAIDATGLSLSQVCRLLDVDYNWLRDNILKGGEETPHLLRVVFMLLAVVPNGPEVARQLTDAVIEKSDSFDMDQKAANAGHHGKQSGFTVERKSPRRS